MITHEDALDLAAIAIDFGITERERAALDAHLAQCSACRHEVAAIQRDVIRLRSLAAIPPPAWVARAIGRKRRPIATLLVAAALLIGGAIGAVTIVGGVIQPPTALLLSGSAPTSRGPSLDPASPPLLHTQMPRTIGWSAGRDMGSPRAFHTATRLVDGAVLIAGGRTPAGDLQTAELYDPRSDSFRPAAPMNRHHSSASATLLPDGRVLVAGGGQFTAEVYDPLLDSWTLTGRMIEQRRVHTAVLLPDGRVLVVGGVPESAATSTAEIFDPASNTWASVGRMAGGRASHTATLLPNGTVLVAGGEPLPGNGVAVDTVEIFDPVTETFLSAPPMLDARSRHTATLLADGRVLAVSGVQAAVVLTSVEVYDIGAETWTRVPDVNEPREAFTLTLLPDGRVLIIGGYSQGTRTAEVRDARTGTWEMAGETNEIRGFHTATALLDGRVLVTGGINWSEDTLASTELWLAAP